MFFLIAKVGKIRKIELLIILLIFALPIRDYRGVAQLASVLAWGARGRKFESSRPDKTKPFRESERAFVFLDRSNQKEYGEGEIKYYL